MWVLASAVMMASLLGSGHCVGMCGPLALWASGATEGQRKKGLAYQSMLYHSGRLITYVIVGIAAGSIGQMVNWGGESLGMRMFAARLVGASMVLFGAWRLWTLSPWHTTSPSKTPSLIGKVLVGIRPWIFGLSPGPRALGTGILTVLLPCGWLYLFAFVAAGTGTSSLGAVVMLAFWLGTVPWLLALVAGASLLNSRTRLLVPILASALLVLTGFYTAQGNGFASIDSWRELETTSRTSVDQLHTTTLPCCSEKPSP